MNSPESPFRSKNVLGVVGVFRRFSNSLSLSFQKTSTNNKATDSLSVSAEQTSSNGTHSQNENGLSITFEGGLGNYLFRTKLNLPFFGEGLGIKVKLSNWGSIRYIAIGYTINDKFRHVRFHNVLQGDWIILDFAQSDLIYKWQNDWFSPGPTVIEDIRIFISGHPNPGQATLEIQDALIWEAAVNDTRSNVLKPSTKKDAIQVAFDYLDSYFPNYKEQSEKFMSEGTLPLLNNINLDWKSQSKFPKETLTSITHRYSWHAQHPALILLMSYHRTKNISTLIAARNLVDRWLDDSFFRADDDIKYAWYDHGTAERLLSFVLMSVYAAELNFDKRFVERLSTAIEQHSVLLASDAFYAAHQRTRYHNHAWFQDIILMFTSLIFDKYDASTQWRSIAAWRFSDQLKTLCINEKGYSVFIENSIGYHIGVMRLVNFAAAIAEQLDLPLPTKEISSGLLRFVRLMQYDEGRLPAQGDTYDQESNALLSLADNSPRPVVPVLLLPQSGYGFVNGQHEKCKFSLRFFGTSLSSTHKHQDNLSFTLFFDGIEWLTDPSFYSHEYQEPIPGYLRSAFAHNTIALRDFDYAIDANHCVLSEKVLPSGFDFYGEHTAYSQVKISRRLSGNVTALEIYGQDFIMPLTESKPQANASLMFHCGNGVCATKENNVIFLTHPKSSFRLILQLPAQPTELFYDHSIGQKIRGVAGLGFMQTKKIWSIETAIPSHQKIEWSILAERLR